MDMYTYAYNCTNKYIDVQWRCNEAQSSSKYWNGEALARTEDDDI